MSVAEVETLPPPVELLPQIPALPMKRLNGLLEPGPRLLPRPDESPRLVCGSSGVVGWLLVGVGTSTKLELELEFCL